MNEDLCKQKAHCWNRKYEGTARESTQAGGQNKALLRTWVNIVRAVRPFGIYVKLEVGKCRSSWKCTDHWAI